ncbi:MAG: hypothetical protein AMS21_13695 [Gemmatimonas sp. SG8_38_2]|nr:MAG: hypothetical protein AMS21_13695 [Gemmatimonas sp. SG8_38_2]
MSGITCAPGSPARGSGVSGTGGRATTVSGGGGGRSTSRRASSSPGSASMGSGAGAETIGRLDGHDSRCHALDRSRRSSTQRSDQLLTRRRISGRCTAGSGRSERRSKANGRGAVLRPNDSVSIRRPRSSESAWTGAPVVSCGIAVVSCGSAVVSCGTAAVSRAIVS